MNSACHSSRNRSSQWIKKIDIAYKNEASIQTFKHLHTNDSFFQNTFHIHANIHIYFGIGTQITHALQAGFWKNVELSYYKQL